MELTDSREEGLNFSPSLPKTPIVWKVGNDPFLFSMDGARELFLDNSRRALLDQEAGNRLPERGMNFYGRFHPGLWHEWLGAKIFLNNFEHFPDILSDNGKAGNKGIERGFFLDTPHSIGYTIYVERKWKGHWWPSWTSNPVRGAERRPGWVRFPCTSANLHCLLEISEERAGHNRLTATLD